MIAYAVVDGEVGPDIIEVSQRAHQLPPALLTIENLQVTMNMQTGSHNHSLEQCDVLRHNDDLKSAAKRCLEGG